MRYASLHNHSVYSIKDAIAKPIDYVKFIHEYNEKNKDHEIVTFAISEHGNLFSMVEYHLACTTPLKNDKNNKTLKPIYANEIYHIDDLDNEDLSKLTWEDYNHLVLIAKTQEGLNNLIKITTHSGLNQTRKGTNKKDFQITDEKFLRSHGKGIIALSACVGGKLSKIIQTGDINKAKKWATEMSNIFDEFYLEIQPHEIPKQLLTNSGLLQIHKDLGLPLVITSDSHYILQSDKKYHTILKEIDFSYASKGTNFNYAFDTENHFWTPEELIKWCNENDIPLEAIENTVKIAESCNVNIKPKDTRGLMPDFTCPNGYDEQTYLNKLAVEGLKNKFINNKDIIDIREYIVRLNYELDIINQMKFSGYFLILWDWFKWCKENQITLGPGRGSAAGSLVAYTLNITKVDPIKNGLIMERFLNPERLEFPDIDSDVSKLDRAKAIEYLKDKYGIDYVCQIVTFGKYNLKNTIRAVLSAKRGFTSDYQSSITKAIPNTIGEDAVSYELIDDIVQNSDDYLTSDKITDREYTAVLNAYNVLQEVFVDNPEVKDAIMHLKGAVSSIGIHAGGVVISSKKIGDYIPLMKGSKTAVLPVCQANMDGIHFFNGLKIDVLGLKNLSQIRLCMNLANIPESWYDDEDTDDHKIYEFLRNGYTANVFQMAKFTPTKMIKDFKVKDLESLTAVNAGNRPGPLAKGENGKSMVDGYVDSVNSGIIEKIDSRIDYILAPTNGMLWYQEQCLELGRVMAGYSLGGADKRIRGVLAKKKIKQIPEIENEFIYGKKSIYNDKDEIIGVSDENSDYCIGAINNGFSEEIARKIFNVMREFSKYAFNKSHKYCGTI